MEFNGVLVLAAVWFLLSLLGRKSKDAAGSRQPEPPRPRPLPHRPDATQQEGSRLELVLRELQRSLEEAAQPARPVELPQPPYEELEGGTLEMEPEVVSLEGEVHREVRRRVDRDDEAESFEARRIEAAAARDTARSKPSQVRIAQPLPQEVAEHTATRTYSAQQLRDAIVWTEILGPPVSLRDGEGK